MLNSAFKAALAAVFATKGAAQAQSETIWLDLTHPIPIFQPVNGNPIETDCNAPWLNSKAHAPGMNRRSLPSAISPQIR